MTIVLIGSSFVPASSVGPADGPRIGELPYRVHGIPPMRPAVHGPTVGAGYRRTREGTLYIETRLETQPAALESPLRRLARRMPALSVHDRLAAVDEAFGWVETALVPWAGEHCVFDDWLPRRIRRDLIALDEAVLADVARLQEALYNLHLLAALVDERARSGALR